MIFIAIQEQQPTEGARPWSEPTEYFRVKGGLNVEFFVNRQGRVSRATDESTVHPGDRVGFRVSTPVAGHLMIVGQDKTGETYLCYPQDAAGQSRAFGPTQEMVTLDQAVVLDEVLGEEHLTAIFCETSFDFATVAEKLKPSRSPSAAQTGRKAEECRKRAIKLIKQPTENP